MMRSAFASLVCLLSVVCTIHLAWAVEYHSNTEQFWELGLGSRSAALGGASCALSDDASALMYNPAGLARLEGQSVLSAALTHPGVGTYGHVTASLGSIAASLHYFDFGTIQQTDVAGNPTGSFSYRNVGLLLGTGAGAVDIPLVSRLRQSELLSFGAALKITAIDTLDPGDGFGISTILGLLIHVPSQSLSPLQLPPFVVGITFDDAIAIPIAYKSGHRELQVPKVHVGVAIRAAEDVLAMVEATSDESFHVGLEWSPSSLLTLRAGASWVGQWLPGCGVEIGRSNLSISLAVAMHPVLGPRLRGTFLMDWD